MTNSQTGSGLPADVSPRATLDAGEENIEAPAARAGIDSARAVSAETFAESIANVGETDMVQYRLTQQALLADFGLAALRSGSLTDLEQLATQMTAAGTRSQMSKLMRYLPDTNELLVCAGVGWKPGIVGHARVGADLASPAGYALRTGKPVLSNHLDQEERFRTPAILAEHGVRRAVNVLINANDSAWGVLEVDSPNDGKFDVADIPFLQGFANLLGVTIERHRAEESLRESIKHQQMLVRESSHRAKNSLALVSSLLHLQSRSSALSDVQFALDEAAARIMTIAKAHDLLWQSDAAGEVDVGRLLSELCAQLQPQMPDITLQSRTDSFMMAAEEAIAAGLLVTELVTNAAKHAYADGRGEVLVICRNNVETFTVSVADKGKGLPVDFDMAKGGDASFGSRMIRSLARQLNGTIDVDCNNGTTVSLTGRPRVPSS